VEEDTRQRELEGCYQESQFSQRAVAPEKKKGEVRVKEMSEECNTNASNEKRIRSFYKKG
jgi:hypothetical protein